VSVTFSDPIAFALECHRKGEFEEAERVYRGLLEQNPGNADDLHLMGMLAHDTGQTERALGLIASAIALRPETPYYHSNLGNVLQKLERFQDAELCYREALRLDPALAEAHNNLGNALRALGRIPEAIGSLLEAVRLNPRYHEAFSNLAGLLLQQSQWREAAACYDEARRIAPASEPYAAGLAAATIRWGDQLRTEGDYTHAIACYQQGVALLPDDPEPHLLLSQALLITGQWEQGWNEFEWRWRIKGCPAVSFRQPLWDGSPLDGRRILLWAEQGLGDTIQFVRYAQMVKSAGGTVVVECQPPLARLLRTCPEIAEVVAFGSPLPDFDVHAPMQSLPRILHTTVESIPARTPYLSADPDLARDWESRLASSRGCRVGLAWAGSPHNREDARRSIAKEKFALFERIPGVDCFSLQKEDVPGDFADAAALMANLDLVISVDTAAAHLAGAFAKPVWTLLPFAPDARWLTGREDSPWYPGMRLFRQTTPGDWEPVLARVCQALELFRDQRQAARTTAPPREQELCHRSQN